MSWRCAAAVWAQPAQPCVGLPPGWHRDVHRLLEPPEDVLEPPHGVDLNGFGTAKGYVWPATEQ
jgi:hypothetical protein